MLQWDMGTCALQDPAGALLKCVHSAKLPAMIEHSAPIWKVEQNLVVPSGSGGRPTEQKLRGAMGPLFSTEHCTGWPLPLKALHWSLRPGFSDEQACLRPGRRMEHRN